MSITRITDSNSLVCSFTLHNLQATRELAGEFIIAGYQLVKSTNMEEADNHNLVMMLMIYEVILLIG